MSWGRAHWFIGLVTLAAFPLAGVYMRYVAVVPELEDAPRMVFRSRFLLLLMAALINLGLSSARPARLLERIASAIFLAAPVPLAASFLLDPARGVQGSPWTSWTIRGLFLAGVLLAIAHRPRRGAAP
jgi:hypothetical protein